MLKILIVDDEPLSVKRLKRILLENVEIDYIQTFLNPLEAYEFSKGHAIDVAFLDISMPEINGMKLSHLLLGNNPSIHIIFVTGYHEYAVQAFELGALDYLMKPVTVERVHKTLDKLKKTHYSEETAPSIEVCLFNGLAIYQKRARKGMLKLRSPKTEELFAFLLCKRRVSREEIIDTLWNGLEPEKALKNLNSTVYYIRKAIGSNKLGIHIQTNKKEVWIEEGDFHCDLYQFERLYKQIKQASNLSGDLFKQVGALYTGELLRGKAYEWASEEAHWLEGKYIEILEAAATFHSKRNELNEALHFLKEVLKRDSLKEDIHYEIIRLYVQHGRKNDAWRQFSQLEELLRCELGTVPDPRIIDLLKE